MSASHSGALRGMLNRSGFTSPSKGEFTNRVDPDLIAKVHKNHVSAGTLFLEVPHQLLANRYRVNLSPRGPRFFGASLQNPVLGADISVGKGGEEGAGEASLIQVEYLSL